MAQQKSIICLHPADLEGLTLDAVQLAIELGVDIDATNLDGQTATQARTYASVRDFLAFEAAR